MRETAAYIVNLRDATILELRIMPDQSGKSACAYESSLSMTALENGLVLDIHKYVVPELQGPPLNAVRAILGYTSKIQPAQHFEQLTGHDEAGSKLLVMENKPDQNLFREVHRKVQDLRDRARKNRDDAVQRSRKVAQDEAQKEGFDRPASVPSEDGSQ